MGNLTGNADKKATKTGKNDKTKDKGRNMLGQKRKSSTRKNNNKFQGNKPESCDEKRNIKKILRKTTDKKGHSKTRIENSTDK